MEYGVSTCPTWHRSICTGKREILIGTVTRYCTPCSEALRAFLKREPEARRKLRLDGLSSARAFLRAFP